MNINKKARKQLNDDTNNNDIDFSDTKTDLLRFHNSNTSVKRIKHEENIFKDPIHQFIKMEDLCLKIIDSPQFQRLHHLKQLGTGDYIFRAAHHTRFEHSLGVACLAEKLTKQLKKSQSSLNITDIDITCVKIAGLCHDLGHGPFSHVYDNTYIPLIYPNGEIPIGNTGNFLKWRHEDSSVDLFVDILKRNCIDISKYGLTNIDLIFISEMIRGTKLEERVGRNAEKFYLYDIVNNINSGLDVDKLDYFQRDIYYSKVEHVNFDRFFNLARVMKAPKVSHITNQSNHGVCSIYDDLTYMICYPQKMIGECVDLFSHRFKMHHEVYTHKSVKKVEYMVN